MATEQATAIVTGAARRVGRRVTEALLADGWAVVAHVRREEDPVPVGAVRVAADLADSGCAATIFAAVDDAGLPPVRLLVNNAARFAPDALGASDAGEFDAHMAINVRAPLALIEQLAGRHRGGEALVVNIGDSKLAAPNPDYVSYTLSKAALAGLTDISARALAPRGIRVNAIAPAQMLASGGQGEAEFARTHALNPLERGVEVDDLIGALRFLIEQKAMTGQTLIIDGGQRFANLPRDVQFLGDSDGR